MKHQTRLINLLALSVLLLSGCVVHPSHQHGHAQPVVVKKVVVAAAKPVVVKKVVVHH